jgi:lipopolysaccharide export system permease protein
MLRDAPVVRFREAPERFLGELMFPSELADPATLNGFRIELNQRLTVPLTALSFAVIPLACLLPGEFNRRGQLKRVLLAVGCALAFQAADLAMKNLTGRYVAAIYLSYVIDLLPFMVGLGILLRRGISFKFHRLPIAALAAR